VIAGLVHPLLALGALLAAVPLIIHLFNRRRHKPLDWAAMRFAQAAWKKIRRRTRFENLFLLLLRMAAVAVLAFALARPFTSGSGPLGGLTEEHQDLVLLLDGSASMSYRPGLDSVWERALERAVARIEDLDADSGDRVRLYLVGDHPRLLSDRSPAEALAMLSTLEDPFDEPFDLSAALTRLLEDLDEKGESPNAVTELVLITDAQRGNFLDQRGTRANKELEALVERGLELIVEPVAATDRFTRRPSNLSVAGLWALDPFGEALDDSGALGAAPVPRSADASFLVRIENSGSRPRDVRVALEVDGERRPARRVEVPGAGHIEVRLDARLTSPEGAAESSGFHRVEAVLEADSLTIDDRRPLVVFAPESIEVLLVDGDPAADLVEDEVGYLLAALEPEGDDALSAGGFQVTTYTADEFAARMARKELDLGRFAVVWLANVEALSPEWISEVEIAVTAGATLVVSVGDRVVPGRYEERLGGEIGLLPARLGERRGTTGRRGGYSRARIERPDHPALAFFADERYEIYFTEVPVYEYLTSTPLEGARVLARLDDAATAGSPLLVERDHGRGRTVLWTTSIDDDWSRFAESPTSLIPLVHELCHGAVQPPGPGRNLLLGSAISAELEAFPEAPMLLRPGGSATAVNQDAEAQPGGTWRLEELAKADRVGFWRLRTRAGSEAAFAVGLDPREGRLERLELGEILNLSPAFVAASEEATADPTSGDGELWRPLIALVLMLLIGESLWARRLTRGEAA